jgi:hypothetical protein
MAEKPTSAAADQLIFPFEFVVPDDLVTQYSNYVMIQNGEHECYLLFLEALPPILMGTREEIAEQARKVKSVKAKCVARIAIAKDMAPLIVKTIRDLGLDKGSGDQPQVQEKKQT